jgi:hypothetical protein
MDWNYPIKDYFKLSEEKREEYLTALAKFYYEKNVSTENAEKFDFTMNYLITRLHMENIHAEKNEDYERAEIFYKLTRLFMEIQEEKEF